ncbi:MAG: hypothetical protein ISP41_18960 [Alphaproteobacteria bacterium]|jgi:hypothetical protein|nr:hypothetical protein [Alphaproteobacteria bacterium]
MLIRLLCSICMVIGTLALGGGVFYAEYLHPRHVDESRAELQALVDTIAEIERQEVIEFNRFILFTPEADGYVKALRERVVDKSKIPAASVDFRVEAYEEGPRLVLRGYTAPAAAGAGRRPVMVYRHELDKFGATVKKTAGGEWIALSGKDARLISILDWL